MEHFCVIDSDGEEFHSNVNLDFSYTEIEEWKHKWDPKRHHGRNGKPRKWGFVTYKVTNTSENFPDDDFEDRALSIALRQWGLRCKDIRFKRIKDKNERADIEMRKTKYAGIRLFSKRNTDWGRYNV